MVGRYSTFQIPRASGRQVSGRSFSVAIIGLAMRLILGLGCTVTTMTWPDAGRADQSAGAGIIGPGLQGAAGAQTPTMDHGHLRGLAIWLLVRSGVSSIVL